ncbi:hypothetical protein LJC59_01710 [Desulfovibrio sp. OttesenSCG-928-A18]|nr:hypothetical protein [Desulfovibrio sp. OttesenSCG-928-A18]
MPRILSLAAERTKAWYYHPAQCPPLSRPDRKLRSERREALQIVIESTLSHLDLASLCLGTPSLDHGFIDVDMKALAATAGIGQRRIERALALFKEAGFLEATQHRTKNEHGDYFGCRAIRVVQAAFFDWLGLGPVLARERRRASAALQQKARQANSRVSEFMRRLTQRLSGPKREKPIGTNPYSEATARRWNTLCGEMLVQGMDPEEARRRTNAALGHPPAR